MGHGGEFETSSQLATRLATGRWSEVWWLGERDVVKPIAPACTASRTMACMRARSSSVAASVKARSPITYVRRAECPT